MHFLGVGDFSWDWDFSLINFLPKISFCSSPFTPLLFFGLNCCVFIFPWDTVQFFSRYLVTLTCAIIQIWGSLISSKHALFVSLTRYLVLLSDWTQWGISHAGMYGRPNLSMFCSSAISEFSSMYSCLRKGVPCKNTNFHFSSRKNMNIASNELAQKENIF